jgi:hypothetical protein
MRGAEQTGACVIPEDPFHVEYQLELLKNYRATVLITTPTNARELMELLRLRAHWHHAPSRRAPGFGRRGLGECVRGRSPTNATNASCWPSGPHFTRPQAPGRAVSWRR